MKPQAAFGRLGHCLRVVPWWALTGQAGAQTFVEHSSEVRMQLDFVVPAAALAKFVPAGFEMNVATQGAAKDCNVRMIFIDRVDITKPDGSPADARIEPARLPRGPDQAVRQQRPDADLRPHRRREGRARPARRLRACHHQPHVALDQRRCRQADA